MTGDDDRDEAVTVLQELGLKEYEARCFVAVSRVDTATAREVSEISEVPRTRVYDAIETLAEAGLIFIQHGSPKRFRAVDVEEAAGTLRRQKDRRIDDLETHLQRLEPPTETDETVRQQEVWSLNGAAAIQTRTEDDVAAAETEVLLLVVEADLLTDGLVERLREAADRGVAVTVGGATPAIADRIQEAVPDARVFETDLDWLFGPAESDEVAISRLLLTDRERLLVGSFYPDDDGIHEEQAIFADGLYNGVVVLLRRLLATGLATGDAVET